jgi:hypothetical protein
MDKNSDALNQYLQETHEKSVESAINCECPVCRKPVTMEDIQAIASNQEGFESADGKNICKDCRVVLAMSANVFCNTCHQLVLKASPGRTSRGFEIKPRGRYHYKHCHRCVGMRPPYTLEEEHFFKTGKYKSFRTGMEGTRNET